MRKNECKINVIFPCEVFLILLFFFSDSFSFVLHNSATLGPFHRCEGGNSHYVPVNCYASGGVMNNSCCGSTVSSPVPEGFTAVPVSATANGLFLGDCSNSTACTFSSSASGYCYFPYTGASGVASQSCNCVCSFNLVSNGSSLSSFCFPDQSSAETILAEERQQCDANGGIYSGTVVQQGSGYWCLEGECNPKHKGECHEDSPNMSPKTSFKRFFGEPAPEMCREPLMEARRQKNDYYYNAKGQAIGSLGNGLPKARMPIYSRGMPRRTAVGELINDSYQNGKTLSDFFLARQAAQNDTCGVPGVDYGYINEVGDTIGGITCPHVRVKMSAPPLESYIEDTDEGKCGSEKMYRFNRAIFQVAPLEIATRPIIFMVDTDYIFEDGYRMAQSTIDSIYRHELGHQKDMEDCQIPKLPPARKVMFDGCFCQNELDSLRREEIEIDRFAYDIIFESAKEVYHGTYPNSEYPDPLESYMCPAD